MHSKQRTAHSAGGVVLNRRGQVLVVNQRGLSWSLPKGHIEKGETILEAARREIYEESGVKNLKFIKLLGSYERLSGGRHARVPGEMTMKEKLTFFLFETDREVLKPIDPHNPEARWVDRDKVAALLTHPKDREFFLSVQKELGDRR